MYDPTTQRYGFQEGFSEDDLATDFLNEPETFAKEGENGNMNHSTGINSDITTLNQIGGKC